MNLNDIPLFSTLTSKLGYLSKREQLISQNVANSDTPGYHPSDLGIFAAPSAPGQGMGGSLAMAAAEGGPGSMTGENDPHSSTGTWKGQAAPDSETRMDGNQVVLEEEMMKLTNARMDYDTAIGFYEKSLNMLQIAIRAPGKSS